MLYPCRKQEGRRERLQEIVGEKDGNKESYREKLAQLLSHNEKHDCFTTGATLSLRLLFLYITFAKYIQLPMRRRRRQVIYGSARLHSSFGMSMLSQRCLVRGRQGEACWQSRPGPLLVCD